MAFKACFLLFLVAAVCADGPDRYGSRGQKQQQGDSYNSAIDNGHRDGGKQNNNNNNGGENGGYSNGGNNKIVAQPSAPNGAYAMELAPGPAVNLGGGGGSGYGGPSLIPIQIRVPAPAPVQENYGGGQQSGGYHDHQQHIPQIQISGPTRPVQNGGYGPQIIPIQIAAPAPERGGYGGQQGGYGGQQGGYRGQQGGYGGQQELNQIQISAPRPVHNGGYNGGSHGGNGGGGGGGNVNGGSGYERPTSQGIIAMPSVGYTKGYSINAPSQYGGNGGGGGYIDDQAEERDYKFSYAVKDDYTYNQQSREENKNGNTITGQYTVLEPTGDLRIVNYVADDYGFRADVQSKGGHGPAAPQVVRPNIQHGDNGYGSGVPQVAQIHSGGYGQEQQQQQEHHHQYQQQQQEQPARPAYGGQQQSHQHKEHHHEQPSSYGQQDQHQQPSGVSYGQQKQQQYQEQHQHQSNGQNYGQVRQEEPLVSYPVTRPTALIGNYGQPTPMLLIQAPIQQQSYSEGPVEGPANAGYNPEAPALHKPVLAAPAYRQVAIVPERKQQSTNGANYGRSAPTKQKHQPTYGRPSAVPKPNSNYDRPQVPSENNNNNYN